MEMEMDHMRDVLLATNNARCHNKSVHPSLIPLITSGAVSLYDTRLFICCQFSRTTDADAASERDRGNEGRRERRPWRPMRTPILVRAPLR